MAIRRGRGAHSAHRSGIPPEENGAKDLHHWLLSTEWNCSGTATWPVARSPWSRPRPGGGLGQTPGQRWVHARTCGRRSGSDDGRRRPVAAGGSLVCLCRVERRRTGSSAQVGRGRPPPPAQRGPRAIACPVSRK